MDAALAVVGGTDNHALGGELRHQLHVVDDITVVRAHHIAIGIEVRLRVHLRRRAESGPAQLHNAALPHHLVEGEALSDGSDLAHVLPQINAAIRMDGGATHRIVAPVGKAMRRADQNWA